ncbi:hypothetical protein CBR_g12742 [Chara braunii]|uniref:Photosystem II reaction center Psb28 protein n=1 Tax=Chara braunii TaxID=69332 RepID=A0A388KSW2_CHABU|nr:hypothetical protein CBR_g12742 [Chara braunii]|eukprot:GBG73023.1 hypothetical protein CBR_g12742 [Chara braunii]
MAAASASLSTAGAMAAQMKAQVHSPQMPRGDRTAAGTAVLGPIFATWNVPASPPSPSTRPASSSPHQLTAFGLFPEATRVAAPRRRSLSLPSSSSSSSSSTASTQADVGATTTAIQFVRGVNERTVPDVRLTRSRDGSTGMATFVFDQPTVFDMTGDLGEITGLFLIDSEGTLTSTDVSARFVNGKPAAIEARYPMKSKQDWNRFMRFMERYAEENNLGFKKS